MKAIICTQYGPPEVLQITEVEKPVPKENEVLIKIRATTVNAADCNARGLSYIPAGLGLLAKVMIGFNKPKKSILGSVLAGEVESVGKAVIKFKPGDRIYGSSDELGAYAEYACRKEKSALFLIPKNLTFEEAASIPYGALTALYFLHNLAGLKPGQTVLVKGASGGVGVYAIQLAKYFGAEVTGVCSTPNIEFVKSLGADKTIDYTKTDYTKTGEKWDIILDVVVGKTSFSKNKNALTKNGKYLAIAGGLNDMLQMIRTSVAGGRKVYFGGGANCEKPENFNFLNQLLENGNIKPVIDSSFPLEKIVQAHRHVETGRKKGNVVITIHHNNSSPENGSFSDGKKWS